MNNPFARLFRSRDKPRDGVSAAPNFYFGTSGAGKSVTVSTAMQMSTVYACVRVIAETIASLPLHVFEVADKGNMKATEHPLYGILHDAPNTEMTSFVMRETMLSHLLLWGNAYVQIIRSGRNRIAGLYPLMPDHMEVDRDSAGNLTYTYNSTEGRTVRLSPDDVLHISGLGFDGVMGYSPIALERNAIGLGLAAEEYGGKFFANGARPSGVLTHPNSVKDPKRLRESWNAAYGGSANANKVCILEEGILNMYERRVRISRGDAADMMAAATWMDAKGAFERGFVDAIADDPAKYPVNAAEDRAVYAKKAEEGVLAWFERKKKPARPAAIAAKTDENEPPQTVPESAAVPDPNRVKVANTDTRLEELKY